MAPSAKVLVVGMRHATSVKPFHMVSAKPSDTTSTNAADVASTKATDVTSAKAANMASAKAAHTATTMSSASASAATAATGLCAGRKQAPGQRCACQNHYHSSFHDILHFGGRIFRRGTLSALGVARQSERQSRNRLEMRIQRRLFY